MATQEEIDAMKEELTGLEAELETASAVVTTLDEQQNDPDQDDPSWQTKRDARDAYIAAWTPWNELEGRIRTAQMELDGVERGPDQSFTAQA